MKPSFVNYTKVLIKEHNPYICCFLETRISDQGSQRIEIYGSAMEHLYATIPRSLRGIRIAWKKNMGQLSLTHMNRQVIFGIISSNWQQPWIVGFVYTNTCGIECSGLWMQA